MPASTWTVSARPHVRRDRSRYRNILGVPAACRKTGSIMRASTPGPKRLADVGGEGDVVPRPAPTPRHRDRCGRARQRAGRRVRKRGRSVREQASGREEGFSSRHQLDGQRPSAPAHSAEKAPHQDQRRPDQTDFIERAVERPAEGVKKPGAGDEADAPDLPIADATRRAPPGLQHAHVMPPARACAPRQTPQLPAPTTTMRCPLTAAAPPAR